MTRELTALEKAEFMQVAPLYTQEKPGKVKEFKEKAVKIKVTKSELV